MLKTINTILIGGMLAGAGVVYYLKYDAERATTRITSLDRMIDQERDKIASLKAEWSLLNQPRRLQELSERYHAYLELDRLDPNQIATIEEIPLRAVALGDAPKPVAGFAAGGKVGPSTPNIAGLIATGSIGKSTDRIHASNDHPIVPKSIDPRPNDPLNAILR